MSPGKFSRKQTTPNKPPVCHKAPLPKLPIGIFPWQRNANLFFKWVGTPFQGAQQRSWNAKLKPAATQNTLTASGQAADISFELFITFSDPIKAFRYQCIVRSPATLFLLVATTFKPLQRVDPWFTGLVTLPPNTFTQSCTFEAMS